jgi:hypothetical protein
MNNHLNIKYIKLVNHIHSNRRDWSYDEDERKTFDLHWIIAKKMTESYQDKILARKEKDAKKVRKGDRILLCQNNLRHGHRVTHLVEVLDEPYETIFENKDNVWKRQVQIILIAKKPWSTAPYSQHVLGENFSFRSGNLVNIDAPSIRFELAALNLGELTNY